jgi:cell division protein FtsW
MASTAIERRKRKPPVTRFGRGDRSLFGTWFWEIDRVLLLLVAILISAGLIAVAAASPAAAARDHLAPLYYLYRQGVWIAIGLPLMIGVSMLPKDLARRLSLVGAAVFFLALIVVPFIGMEKNGASRWIGVGMFQFQPSEFLKPLFVVTIAWLLSLRMHDRSLPVVPLTGVIALAVAGLLMKQPDFGQTVIFLSVWLALLLLSGVSMRILVWLGGLGLAAIVAAYLFYPVATKRIDAFLYSDGDNYQTEKAHNALMNGGLIGTGPGGGTMKFRLPEPHNDYIFAVIGEEFGLLACLAIALLYLAIVIRVFIKLLHEEDDFLLLATQFGLQAIINMAVNVQLAPSKGMTLPFISYGGSSMVALSIGMGLLLAFTRRNPYLTRSPYVIKWSGR